MCIISNARVECIKFPNSELCALNIEYFPTCAEKCVVAPLMIYVNYNAFLCIHLPYMRGEVCGSSFNDLCELQCISMYSPLFFHPH